MSILDKITGFADDVGVKLIKKASEKQKRINALLEEEGSDVRIGSFEVNMGTPPSITFCVESVPEK